jgi:hypothetical protein
MSNDSWADGAHIVGQPDTFYDPLAKYRNSDEWKIADSPLTRANRNKRLVEWVNEQAAAGDKEVLSLLPADQTKFRVQVSGTDWVASGVLKRDGWRVTFEDGDPSNAFAVIFSKTLDRNGAISAADSHIRDRSGPEYNELSDAESAALQRLALSDPNTCLMQYVYKRLPADLAAEYARLAKEADRTGNYIKFLEFAGSDSVHEIVEEAVSTIWTWSKPELNITPDMRRFFEGRTDGRVLSFALLDNLLQEYESLNAADRAALEQEPAPSTSDLEALDDETVRTLYRDTLRLRSQTRRGAPGVLA